MRKAGLIAAACALLFLADLAVRHFLLGGVFGQGPYYYQILILAGINIILAVSLNLTNGITGQFSIGHAGFFAVGAYVSGAITVYGGPLLRPFLAGLPVRLADAVLLLSGLSGAALATALAGLLVGIPSLRLRGDYLAIVTLGFGEIIRVLILNIEDVGGARGFIGIPKLSDFLWVFAFVILVIVVVKNLLHSSYGRSFIAIRENEIAAQAMGVDITRSKVLSFMVGAVFAGLAGSLFAQHSMYLHPNSFTFIRSFEIIIMIALGGLGSVEGAVLGAVLLTLLPEAFRGFEELRMVLYSLVLIFIMIYRPQGILGSFSLGNFRKKRDLPHKPPEAGAPEGTPLPSGPEGLAGTGGPHLPVGLAGSRGPHPANLPDAPNGPPVPHVPAETPSPGPLLALENVTIRFGGLVAVKDLSFTVGRGELFGLIGPNGAGKTTVFNLITGVYRPTAGRILLEGRPVQGLPPHRIASRGISRTFQNIRLFPEMSVLDNVKVSHHMRKGQNLVHAVWRSAAFHREESEVEAEALDLLALFHLNGLRHEKAGNLPYGSQRRLEIVRALAAKPKLLLLDEPAAGMNPQESLELMRSIAHIRDRFNLSILLVEHNMKVVMGVCERLQVIDHGEALALGRPAEIRRDPKVIEAYLGKE